MWLRASLRCAATLSFHSCDDDEKYAVLFVSSNSSDGVPSGSRKLLRPTPTRRKRWAGPRSIRFRRESAIDVNSSHETGGTSGVWLRVRMLKSLVFSLSTTVRPTRGSFREADQTFSASRRMSSSVSDSGISRGNVSSAEIDLVSLSGTTLL
jgi:hypothetical protein